MGSLGRCHDITTLTQSDWCFGEPAPTSNLELGWCVDYAATIRAVYRNLPGGGGGGGGGSSI